MTKEVKRRQIMFERADQFCAQLTLVPAGTSLVEDLKATIALIKELGRDQVSGRGGVKVSAVSRAQTADELRSVMRLIVSVAQRLSPADFPRIAEQFQLPRNAGYQPLLDTARAFERNMAPVQTEFVDRLTQEVVDLLPALIAQFETSSERKLAGVNGQVNSTAGLKAAAALGMKIVRELNPFIRALFRGNPAQLETWKRASRVERTAPKVETPVANDVKTQKETPSAPVIPAA